MNERAWDRSWGPLGLELTDGQPGADPQGLADQVAPGQPFGPGLALAGLDVELVAPWPLVLVR